jgi:glucose-1-phosphate thymidylyltransferase
MELRGVLVVEDAGDGTGAEPAAVPAAEQVANRPIVHHVLDELESVGAVDVIVATSDRCAERVRACLASRETPSRASLRFVSRPGPVDLGSGLCMAAPLVGPAPCIVHAAGGLLAEPLAWLTAGLDGRPDAIIAVHQTPSPEQPLSATAQRLLHLAELDPSRSALGVAGVWAFGPGALQLAVSAGRDGEAVDLGPAARSVDLGTLAERISAGGGTVSAHRVDIWRAFRGGAADLLELNRLVLDRLEPDMPPGITDGNRIEGRIRVHETASVTDSVLVGPAVIGPGAQIRDAYIGPYTAIGVGCRIEGAEIERSIVCANAHVSHVGSRITDSVVGPGARLFRHFSMPRALRVRVGADAELGLC